MPVDETEPPDQPTEAELAPLSCPEAPRIRLDPIKAVLLEVERKLQRTRDRTLLPSGLPTGMKNLDDMLGGLRPGELVAIAGERGMGTTELMLAWVRHLSCYHRTPTLLFTLREAKAQLCQRLLIATAEVDWRALSAGLLGEKDWASLREGAAKLAGAPIHFDDTQDPTLEELSAAARRWRGRQEGPALIVIDGLQALEETRPPAARNWRDWWRMSRALKSLAVELHAIVVVSAGLQTTMTERADMRPIREDLDPQELERVADVLLFLHREELYSMDRCAEEDRGITEVIVAKGPMRTGTARFRCFYQRSRFKEVSDREYAGIDWPLTPD